MKLLVLTSVYPQQDDGDFNVTPTVQYFSEKWAEQGHEVIVIHNNSCFPIVFYLVPESIRLKMSSKLGFNFPTKESRKEISFKKERIAVYRLPIVKTVPHGKFGPSAINKQIKKITSILEANSFVPDLIVAHWVNPQIQLLISLGEMYNAKTSLVFHDDCSQKNINRFNLINEVKKLSAVGCRSKVYSEYVQEALGLSKKPFLCYSGIPDHLAMKCALEQESREYNDTTEYVYVGRLVKFKNVDTIIEALHKVYGDKKFKFHIVGSGAERENLESLVKQYKMDDRVFFHGQISRDKVFELMKKVTYFIMVSDNETFGMVYIEAMLAGCITIASVNGGVDGVIIDGENGFLSPQGDAKALAEKLKDVSCLDVSKRNSIRKSAINTALKFSDTCVSQKYLDDVLSWK